MSKPRYPWYGEVKRRIMEGNWQEPKSFQDYILMKAMFEAKKDTEKLPNADIRLEAIEAILERKTSTYNSFGMNKHYDWRTVQNWITSFVNLVGKKAGY